MEFLNRHPNSSAIWGFFVSFVWQQMYVLPSLALLTAFKQLSVNSISEEKETVFNEDPQISNFNKIN